MYNKIKRLFYSFVALALCLCISPFMGYANKSGTTPLPLNKEDVIERAIETSETYQISKNQVHNLHEQYREVRAQILPQINGESSWTFNASFPGDTTDDYDAVNTISGTQVLWAFGRIRSAISAAHKAFDISHLDKNSTERDVIYSAQLAYYTALFAEETFSIIESSYQNVLESKEILEERSAKGRVSKQDNIKISADVAARIPEVSNARAQLKTALNSLKIITGIPFTKEITLSKTTVTTYAPLDYNKLEADLMTNEPSLRALQESIHFREDLVQQRKAEYLPAVSAFGSYSYKGGGDKATIHSNNLDSHSSAGVKVSVPIFSGFETTAKLEQAKIEKSNAELSFKQAAETLTLELHNAVSDYHSYIETLSANNEAVRLAEESFRLSQELFTTGQITVNDLNDAELQLTNQRLAKEQTLFNINVTLAQIEKLTTPGELS